MAKAALAPGTEFILCRLLTSKERYKGIRVDAALSISGTRSMRHAFDRGTILAMETRQTKLRFLIVEDEVMITILLQDYLEELGLKSEWHADTIESALRIIENESPIDGAILDVNIRGRTIRPVADALAARDIPFCFMTGYGAGADTGYPDAPIIGKPFDIVVLENILRRLTS